MADSEISRTLATITRGKDNPQNSAADELPYKIDRRNLLPVAARLLSAHIAGLRNQPRESGPTPVRELWPRWHACHQQCVQATGLRQKLATEMLKETGGSSLATLQSLRKVDAGQFPRARAELRERRKRWKEADRQLGYSAAAALEQELAEQAAVLARLMLLMRPSSLTEVTAKLHCLIVTHDPGLKLEDAPWPDLRRLLKDLVRIAGAPNRIMATLEEISQKVPKTIKQGRGVKE